MFWGKHIDQAGHRGRPRIDPRRDQEDRAPLPGPDSGREAGDLKQAIALVAQVRPDVVVLDITLPDFDGLEGLGELRRHFPGLRVVMLSMHPEERYALATLRAGALGYARSSGACCAMAWRSTSKRSGANRIDHLFKCRCRRS
jgi:DNA-binding NarL/FixJ family response regulator